MSTQQTTPQGASPPQPLSARQLHGRLQQKVASLTQGQLPSAIRPQRSLDALLAQWTTQEVYRIEPDVENPLDALFNDENRPWAVFWIPPQEQSSKQESDLEAVFGHLIWAQFDAQAFLHTRLDGLLVHDNGQRMVFHAAVDPAYKKQQARFCQALITGNVLKPMGFSELLCQLYNLARIHQQNPIQFLQTALFSQPGSHHRYQESLFSILEYPFTACNATSCRQEVIQQLIGKTLSLMLFKALHKEGKIQAIVDVNRLRNGMNVLNSARELMGYNPLFQTLPEYQKIHRRLNRLMRDWHL